MFLSYDPAFLFVHIDKAAGSSIQIALESCAGKRIKSRLRRRLVWLGPLNRWLGLYRALEFPEHAGASVARRCLPADLYDRLFKFAFVRNPWDRLVSRYAYLLRTEDHPRHGLVSGMKGFEEYLAWEISRGKMHQHAYVTDARGQWIVNFVGYFERLHEDFAEACARLKIQAQLPRANASSHKDYRTYYTPATRDLVAEHFRRDIELFGYRFEGLGAGVPQGLASAARRNN
jgi:sulfotransferase famil protein